MEGIAREPPIASRTVHSSIINMITSIAARESEIEEREMVLDATSFQHFHSSRVWSMSSFSYVNSAFVKLIE